MMGQLDSVVSGSGLRFNFFTRNVKLFWFRVVRFRTTWDLESWIVGPRMVLGLQLYKA